MIVDHEAINICVPSKADSSMYWRVIMTYLKEHPEKLHLAALQLARVAVGEAYPCTSVGALGF